MAWPASHFSILSRYEQHTCQNDDGLAWLEDGAMAHRYTHLRTEHLAEAQEKMAEKYLGLSI